MEKEIRTFVAIKVKPEAELLDQWNGLKERFSGESINWVPEGNLHLTLRFIGNTSRTQLYDLVDAFEKSLGRCKSFKLELKRIAYFKTKGKPRVLYVGISGAEQLEKLSKQIEEDVVSCGFHHERKPFRPHLTLGRIKYLEDRDKFIAALDELPEKTYQEVNVKAFILYQSILKPEGPSYKPIKIFTFK